MKLPPGYVPGLLQQHKATAKGGFGERLLRQYGWTEGKGLGANETGMAEALRVKQKKDQTGVGAHGSEMWRDKWWEEAYAQSVATISGTATGPNKLPADSSSDSDSDSSDSNDSTAEVPAVTARRVHADGTSSSATEAEHKLAVQLAKDPWGRFGGRQGKLARIRAQEQAAIQAMQAASAAVSQSAAASQAVAAAAAGAADSDAVSPRQKHAKRRKQEAAQLLKAAAGGAAGAAPTAVAKAAAQPKAKRRKGDKAAVKAAQAALAPQQKEAAAAPAQPREPTAADLAAEAAAAAMRAFKPTPATGWWGAKRFVSSGALGSTILPPDPQKTDAQAHGFTEATQEGLYMALHNAKTSGKTGLGKGKGSGIVGGAKWEGKKTVIQDDDEAGASAETTYADELPAAGDPSAAEPSAAAQCPVDGAEPTSPRAAPGKKSFKYGKLVRKLVRQADGQQIPLKRLAKQVRQHWTAAAAQHGAPPDATSMKAILRVKLERIDGVELQGKQVMLSK